MRADLSRLFSTTTPSAAATTSQQASASTKSGEFDQEGVDLGVAGRQALMTQLAAGTGLAVPAQAQQILSLQQHATMQATIPAIATQCFLLSNMFDPSRYA